MKYNFCAIASKTYNFLIKIVKVVEISCLPVLMCIYKRNGGVNPP